MSFPLKKLNLDGPCWWRSCLSTRPFNLIPSLPQGVPKSARLEAIWESSSTGLNKTNFSCGLWKEKFSIKGLLKTRLWCGRDSRYMIIQENVQNILQQSFAKVRVYFDFFSWGFIAKLSQAQAPATLSNLILAVRPSKIWNPQFAINNPEKHNCQLEPLQDWASAKCCVGVEDEDVSKSCWWADRKLIASSRQVLSESLACC